MPQEKLIPLWGAIGQDNMPALCKYALTSQGVLAGVARRPVSPATGVQKAAVRAALAGLGPAGFPLNPNGDRRLQRTRR